MKTYTATHVVKNEDLNHHGTLFGARAAAWFVEAGLLAVAKECGGPEKVVMRNILDMSFCKPIKNGTLLEFTSRIVFAGNTSLVVGITAKDAYSDETFIGGYVSYVTVEPGTGKKNPHHITLDVATCEEESLQRNAALKLLNARKDG